MVAAHGRNKMNQTTIIHNAEKRIADQRQASLAAADQRTQEDIAKIRVLPWMVNEFSLWDAFTIAAKDFARAEARHAREIAAVAGNAMRTSAVECSYGSSMREAARIAEAASIAYVKWKASEEAMRAHDVIAQFHDRALSAETIAAQSLPTTWGP